MTNGFKDTKNIKNHYVYRITNIKELKHYYGTRSCNGFPSEDLGIKYFSSSSDKNFILDQKTNPHHYTYKIIRIYNSREEALKLEIKLHNKFDVGINESFYNLAKQTSTGFDTTGRKYKHSEETKRLISLGNLGKTISKEQKERLSRAKLGLKSPLSGLTYEEFYGFDRAQEIKLKMIGPKSEDHKANLRKPKVNTENMGVKNMAVYITENGDKKRMNINEALERGLDAESKGRKYTDEVNKRKSCPGSKNGMFGKCHSKKVLQKIGDCSRGTVTCFDLETGKRLRIPKEIFNSESRYVGSSSKKIKEYYENQKNKEKESGSS